MSHRLPKLVAKINGKTFVDVVLVRGDLVRFEMTFTQNKTPVDISDPNVFNQLLWVIVRSVEEKDMPVANGTGTIIDDGSLGLRGRVDIAIDLSGVDDGIIEDEECMVIEFTFVDISGNQMTQGQFEVPIRQDAQ